MATDVIRSGSKPTYGFSAEMARPAVTPTTKPTAPTTKILTVVMKMFSAHGKIVLKIVLKKNNSGIVTDNAEKSKSFFAEFQTLFFDRIFINSLQKNSVSDGVLG